MKKTIGWTITITLTIWVIAFGFMFFSPDYNIYTVRSDSMTPTMTAGDMIITGPPSAELKTGAIITFERGDDLFTHRIWAIEEDQITTKGDALEEPDLWTVSRSDIRGVYIFRLPKLGYVPDFVGTKLGWFLSIILPAALPVGWLVKDIVKEALSDA